MLKRKCNCTNPEESHKWCTIDLDTEYSTFDVWYLHNSDNVMVYPERIKDIAEELDCPYKLLNDDKIRDEIIDWVDTPERMQWTPPPEKRKYFIEKSIFEDKPDIFDENANYETLFNIFCDSIRNETDERKKIDLLLSAHTMVNDLGTNESYCKIRLNNDQEYYIPYANNKASLDYLHKLLKDGDPTKGQKWVELGSKRCHCEQNHNGWFYIFFKSKKEITTLRLEQFVRNVVSKEKMVEILGNRCPYLLLDDTILVS